MPALLLQLAQSLNSSVFVLLGILFVVFYGIYRLGSWSQKFKHHDDKMKSLEDMRDTVIRLDTKVELIYKNTIPMKLVQSQSPISLTDLGKTISEKIQVEKILGRNLSQLSSAVDAKGPKNAYDIQMASMQVAKEKMLSLLNESELALIKQEAFQRGIVVEDMADIFGVLLRNHILQQKGLPIAEVDQHEPKS